jgi:hypothetical protein
MIRELHDIPNSNRGESVRLVHNFYSGNITPGAGSPRGYWVGIS